MMNSQMTTRIVLNILNCKVTESYHSGIRIFIDSLYDNYNSKCPSSAHNDDNDGKLPEPEERGGESYAECWLASPHHHGTQLTPASCHHARCTQVGAVVGGTQWPLECGTASLASLLSHSLPGTAQ